MPDGRCKIVAAVDASGVSHAQVFFIWDDRYVYYFLSTRDKCVAHLGAVSLLVWTGIELAHSSQRYFDFDGGITDDAGYKFKVAFGGELANRFDVVRSTSRYQIRRTIRRIPRAIMRRISPRAWPMLQRTDREHGTMAIRHDFPVAASRRMTKPPMSSDEPFD